MENNNFWSRVKPLIKAHNMTQKQFAEHLGFRYHTFRNWIHYERVPTLQDSYDIALSLGVTLDYLLSGKNRDLADIRKREIELRKTAGKVLKMTKDIQKQLLLMRPI